MNLESCSLTKLSIRKKEWREKTMKSIFKVLLCVCALSVSGAGAAYAGPKEDVAAAFERKDYATGLRILLQLADAGDAEAQHALGLIYANGTGVKKNDAEALKWIRKAADQGNADAEYNLYELYRDGKLGLSRDVELLEMWLLRSAEHGNPIAQSLIGWDYDTGQNETKQNYHEAVKWYRKSANQGYASGQFSLGTKYKNGEGVTKDYVEAYKWWSLAAGQQPLFSSNVDSLEKTMTREQIAEAQKLAREWKPTK